MTGSLTWAVQDGESFKKRVPGTCVRPNRQPIVTESLPGCYWVVTEAAPGLGHKCRPMGELGNRAHGSMPVGLLVQRRGPKHVRRIPVAARRGAGRALVTNETGVRGGFTSSGENGIIP